MVDNCECGGPLHAVKTTEDGWLFRCAWCGKEVVLDDFWEPRFIVAICVLIVCLVLAAFVDVPV